MKYVGIMILDFHKGFHPILSLLKIANIKKFKLLANKNELQNIIQNILIINVPNYIVILT